MTQTTKITLHMVASLDGFISKKDNSVDWMHSIDSYEKGKTLTDEDIAVYLQSIHCYIMGSKTYEHALNLGWPYGDTPVVVLSSRDLESQRESVSFYSGSPDELINNLKSQYQNIWIVGGAMITKQFLKANLVDEIVYTIIPILLGEGLPFFDYIGGEIPLHLKDVTAFKDGGMVELTYEVLRN